MITVAGDGTKRILVGVLAESANVGRLAVTKPLRSLRRTKASSRWRSEALVIIVIEPSVSTSTSIFHSDSIHLLNKCYPLQHC